MTLPKLPFRLWGDTNYRETLEAVGLTPRSIEVVMEAWPDPMGLMGATEVELRAVGVSEAQTRRLLGSLDMVRLMTDKPCLHDLSTPKSVAALLMPTMGFADQEIFVALSLNSHHRVMQATVAAVGDVGMVYVTARCVFRDAIRVMAAGVVLAHNHPSGNPEPSDADVMVTNRFVRAGELLGIHVWDHVVIGRGGEFRSLQRMGLVHRRPQFR